MVEDVVIGNTNWRMPYVTEYYAFAMQRNTRDRIGYGDILIILSIMTRTVVH